MKLFIALLFTALAAIVSAPVAFAQATWLGVAGNTSNDYVVREVTLTSPTFSSAILRVDPRSLVGMNFISSAGGSPSMTVVVTNGADPTSALAISPTLLGPVLVTTASQTHVGFPITGLQVRLTGTASETLRVRVYELDSVRNRGYR